MFPKLNNSHLTHHHTTELARCQYPIEGGQCMVELPQAGIPPKTNVTTMPLQLITTVSPLKTWISLSYQICYTSNSISLLSMNKFLPLLLCLHLPIRIIFLLGAHLPSVSPVSVLHSLPHLSLTLPPCVVKCHTHTHSPVPLHPQ